MAYFIDNKEVTKTEFYARLPEIQAHVKKVNEYVNAVQSGEMALADVPEEYRAEVEEIINAPEPPKPNKFGLTDEQLTELEQDTIDKIVQEVSA